MATLTIAEAVEEYKIGLHTLELYNRLMSGDMMKSIDTYNEKVVPTIDQLLKEYKKTPYDAMTIALLFRDLIEAIEKHRKETKVYANVAGRYIEVIGDKWLSFFMASQFYTEVNKEFYLEQCLVVAKPFFERTYQNFSSILVSNVDTLQEFLASAPFTELQRKEVEKYIEEIRRLSRYVNLFESLFLRCTLLICQTAIKNDLDSDGSFTKLLEMDFDQSRKISTRNRLSAVSEDMDVTVWRYMSLTKFLSILFTGKLFFPSVRLLKATSNDPYEGKHLSIDSKTAHDLKQIMPNTLKAIDETNEAIQDSTFISSWYVGENESPKMWDAFTGEEKIGVAIKTTTKKLLSSLRDTKLPLIPTVVAYNTIPASHLESLEIVAPFVYKNPNFDYESEFRVIIIDISNASGERKGIQLDVSLEELLEEIILSPTTPPWMINVYSKIFSTLNIKPKLSFSTIKPV